MFSEGPFPKKKEVRGSNRERKLELSRHTAQRARFRKKQRLGQLEEAVVSIQRSNENLSMMNHRLAASLLLQRHFMILLEEYFLQELVEEREELNSATAVIFGAERGNVGAQSELQLKSNRILKLVTQDGATTATRRARKSIAAELAAEDHDRPEAPSEPVE